MGNKILIIDDDEALCDEVSSSLEDAGYDVSISNDGVEGNALVSSDDFDVLLLDLRLPGLSGHDILKELRQKKRKLHVIVVSGQVDDARLRNGEQLEGDDVVKTIQLADGFLSKPFNMDKLLSMIKEATRRKTHNGSKTITH